MDTNGADKSVIISKVYTFQRLKCMQEWWLGWEKGVLFREVSSCHMYTEGSHCRCTESL